MKFLGFLRAADRLGIGRLSLNVIGAAILLVVVAASYTAWDIFRERDATLERAYSDAETMTLALTEHASRTFDMTIGLLDRVDETIRNRGGIGALGEPFRKDLQRELYGSEDVFQAVVVARPGGGGIVAASYPVEGTDAAEIAPITRPFLEDPNYSGPHFSRVFKSPATGEWVVAIAKGYYLPGGKMEGVIAVTVRLAHFQDAYERVRGPNVSGTSVALYDMDGFLLARMPEVQGPIGTRTPTAKANIERALSNPRGRIQVLSGVDGNVRLAVARRVADYPAVIVTSHRFDEVIAPWRARALQALVVFTAGTLALLGLSLLLARQALELGRSQERFRLATHGAGVGIWDADIDQRRNFLSSEAWQMIGYRPEELPSEPRRLYAELAHPDEKAELEAGIDRIVGGHKGALSMELRLRCKDGAYRWFEITGMAVAWDGDKPTRIAGTTVNIEQRRIAQEAVRESANRLELMVGERTRELEAANRELESFSYSVSHDLRAPVRHVNAFARLALDSLGRGDQGQARAYLERVQRSGEHMDKVIADLLALARVSRSQPLSVATDISALARDAIERLRESDPGRRVEAQVEPGLVARADPGLMGVVLENLISNAWKFTRPRDVAQITVGREDAGASSAYFVRDNGVGFDPGRASRLFDPFVRLHSETEFEGTGIGLATVKRALERQGGEIRAESAIGKGTVFRFTLPD